MEFHVFIDIASIYRKKICVFIYLFMVSQVFHVFLTRFLFYIILSILMHLSLWCAYAVRVILRHCGYSMFYLFQIAFGWLQISIFYWWIVLLLFCECLWGENDNKLILVEEHYQYKHVISTLRWHTKIRN